MLFSIWQMIWNNKKLLVYLFLTNEGVRMKKTMVLRTEIHCYITLLKTDSKLTGRNYTNSCTDFFILNTLIIKVSNLDWFLLLCLDRATAVQVHLYLIQCNKFQFQPLSSVANIATSDYFSAWFWPELLATSAQLEFWSLAKPLRCKPKMKCKSEVMENSSNGTFQNKVTQAST